MLIKKREKKKLRYEKEWFMSEINLNGKTYYSRDGFSFSYSRQERITLNDIIKDQSVNTFQVLAIENDSGDIASIGSNYSHISLDIIERVLILKVRP